MTNILLLIIKTLPPVSMAELVRILSMASDADVLPGSTGQDVRMTSEAVLPPLARTVPAVRVRRMICQAITVSVRLDSQVDKSITLFRWFGELLSYLQKSEK